MAWSAVETPPQAWAACWRRVQLVAHAGNKLLPLTRTCAATKGAKRRAGRARRIGRRGRVMTVGSFIARMGLRGGAVAWAERASNGWR